MLHIGGVDLACLAGNAHACLQAAVQLLHSGVSLPRSLPTTRPTDSYDSITTVHQPLYRDHLCLKTETFHLT